MQPLLLQGPQALSGFRAEALLGRLKQAAPSAGIRSVEASYLFMLDVDREPDGRTVEQAQALLGAGGAFKETRGFLVTPRKGTISPWSSKATDIFHNCGLAGIHRVERGTCFVVRGDRGPLPLDILQPVLGLLHDRMTEGVYLDVADIFDRMEPAPLVIVDVLKSGVSALRRANTELGLALSEEEMAYLHEAYSAAGRNPTDVELVMFGQVNSEHCRHKVFNAEWILDGVPKDISLFGMIRNTHAKHPGGTLVAYRDNSAVVEGFEDVWYEVARDGTRRYQATPGRIDMIMKVETHNHPTAISPYPGAATGVGGEIRDESATGRGSKSKAGLSAFMVSNLRVPGFEMPWENNAADSPSRIATPLSIMIEGPIGGARFGNEYGRPQLMGLFRTYEDFHAGRRRGYHKPIMVAGGMGNIKRECVSKRPIAAGSLIVQLGGPAMRIGLGGGAASSMATGSNAAGLDFDSVQRDNAEMQRRCQEVIDACIAMGEKNPILSIHDIGAGGLSNGCPELVAESGGEFDLRRIHNEDRSMSPMEIWCCEAQERYVLAINPECEALFRELCERERCKWAVIGRATGDKRLVLHDKHFGNDPINIDIDVILGKPPRMLRNVRHVRQPHPALRLDGVSIADAAERVLRMPAVADKTFLITIADRTVTGLVTRDQMAGPWQTPVSDVAVTSTSRDSFTGEAMAMGERTPLALIDPPASGRMAVAEALTNMAAACVGRIGSVKLSANWMCACGEDGEDASLYDTVRAVAMDFCPRVGVAIPVGKDSLSMRTVWRSADGTSHKVVAPLSLVVSSFAPVLDVRKTVTPDLKPGSSRLLFADLSRGRNRLGGSVLAQAYNQVGDVSPDADSPEELASFFRAIQRLVERGLLMAYHDRSDGGLFVTLAEMAFAGRRGAAATVNATGSGILAALFSEELGAVLQVADDKLDAVTSVFADEGIGDMCRDIGAPADDGRLTFSDANGETLFSERVLALHRAWSELTFRMQSLRDDPVCAREEYDRLQDETDPGMTFKLTFNPASAPLLKRSGSARPLMAILREQGVNGQVEMAAAFGRAGFECIDVHMTDLQRGKETLDRFAGLVACGGFSYGDVLGAGSGWAKSILFNDGLKEMFAAFFARHDSFTLGICNGCQMISQLKGIIPGAESWPVFRRNRSEQFEARYSTVEILPSPSVLLRGMEGSRLGIPVAHGEGRADFSSTGSEQAARAGKMVCARFVDSRGEATERYPFNPNGSPGGITAFTTTDGRVTIMMPHPERAFRSVQLSYAPPEWRSIEQGPWLRLFQNARAFADAVRPAR
jgi:phosphoribosylformylglycinamidine synthase